MAQKAKTNQNANADETKEVVETTAEPSPDQQAGLAAAMMGELAGISSIRNIIFGDQIREYNERFEAVDQEIKLINEKIDQFRADISEQLDRIESQLSQRTEQVAEESGKNLQHNISEVNHTIVVQITELREQVQQDQQGLQEKILAEIAALIKSKLDRAEFAKSLITFGTNLREVAGQWESVAEESSDE